MTTSIRRSRAVIVICQHLGDTVRSIEPGVPTVLIENAPGSGDMPVEGSGAEVRRQETLLKTGALQNAILNSANFSSIATDDKGVIQLFNVGAERMLGYAAADVLNKITPADISDPQELIARADVPVGSVINEYVDVAHAFYDKRESGFVNGLLDAIAKDVRK